MSNIVKLGSTKAWQKGEKRYVSAPITVDGTSFELFYSVAGMDIAKTSEPFVAAALFAAMRKGYSLEITDPVSAKRIASLSTFQDVMCSWFEDTFRKIKIDYTPRKSFVPDRKRGTASFFTAGVDSFYIFLKNQKHMDALILVHGFDMKLNDIKLRDKVSGTLKKIAEHYGKRFIEVETNLREFTDPYGNWGSHVHGGALACVAQLFSGDFQKVYIASSDSYRDITHWGSHPLTDPLWSTEDVKIEHAGCEATRLQKTARIVRDDFAVNHLRVCHKNINGAYNCGRCEKCLRTMLNLLMMDSLHQCRAFEEPFYPERIRWSNLGGPVIGTDMRDALKRLKEMRASPYIIDVVQDCVHQTCFKGIKGWPKRLTNAFKKRVLRRHRNGKPILRRSDLMLANEQ